MTWAICFDFPELDDPVFAGFVGDTLGIAPTLRTAATFTTEEAARRTLESCFGAATREWGCVVEVDRVPS